MAIRGAVAAGSIVDITIVSERPTSVKEVNSIFEEEAGRGRERFDGILGVTHDPIVSSDVIRGPRASIVDLTMTQVVKIMSWYDNEGGYPAQRFVKP